MNNLGTVFEAIDKRRKSQGDWLDRFNLGRQESPYRIVLSRPGVRLRCYGVSRVGKPALLIVPAPIKAPYIWDLSRQRSVVQRALQQGLSVFLAEWAEPVGPGIDSGLNEYAGTLLTACVNAIADETRSHQVFLAGHSLGGTLSAIYAAGHPERVAGLILIEAPLHFAEATGSFKTMLDLPVSARSMVSDAGRVPGSLLSLVSASAAPVTFYGERFLDYLVSHADRGNLETYWRVQRWTLDELPLPGKLFEEVVEHLYRGNRFMRGTLMIEASRRKPADVTSPVFAVVDPFSRIIPPESILRFCSAVRSESRQWVSYFGDQGVALSHVGALVGTRAHGLIWPRIFDWVHHTARQ